MLQVAPSILSADFANLERDCRRVISAETPFLHMDVMDGVFVPNISIGLPVLSSLRAALPEAVLDVHLMIVQPEKYIAKFAKAGADEITIHIEATQQPAEALAEIRSLGCRAGLSLRPGTAIETLFPLLRLVDNVLIMSVEPGFGGQKFMPEAPGRIAALRAEAVRQRLPLCIQVDGGINLQTAALCASAGADYLVAGSSVFGAADPAKALASLRRAGERSTNE